METVCSSRSSSNLNQWMVPIASSRSDPSKTLTMAPSLEDESHVWGQEHEEFDPPKPFSTPSIVAIQFSFFHPFVSSDTYGQVFTAVMNAVAQNVICGDGFGLISDDKGASQRDECNESVTMPLSSTPLFEKNITVLRQAPVFVQDRHHNGTLPNNVTPALQWTSWTVYYHILQFGTPMMDMALVGSGEVLRQYTNIDTKTTTIITDVQETDEGGIQIHFAPADSFEIVIDEVFAAEPQNDTSTVIMEKATMESLIQDVMKLALQVNIMEGTMDAAIKSRLPGARYSLPGQEVETFPATFSNFDNNATQQASNHTVSSETQTTPSSVSMVAMSMYASHSMRHCGVGLLLATLLVWGLLLRAAKRRRHLHFERDHFSLNSWNICREEDAIPDHVKLNYNRTVKQRKNSGAGRYNSSAGLFIVLTLVPLVTCTDESSRRMPPNFVIVLTDDLDWTLGGANASTLRRTRKLIAEQGKTFSNWFVQTPVCCPSRAELLTGQLFHNLKLTENTSPGCMHVNVSNDAAHPFYSRNYFAPYFSHNKTLQYNVGVFGKHLNSYNPSDFMLPGVDEMLINGGGMYLDPTFTFGRGNDESVQSIHFNTCTNFTGMPCYSTSVIGNVSLGWIERHVKGPKKQQPFMTLISVKAPHILDGDGFPLSTPAPWYENTSISETTAPRTPNYNYSGYPDHHWLVRSQGPLTQEEGERIDALYVSRLKTLISVDDLVEELIHKLEQWNVLNNTYIFFTSDNGYRLGQFRMPMCKLHPYENDIRVPMMIRGPGIEKNSTSSLVSTHVNLMPTLMGLATGHHHSQDVVPATMDGTNLAASIIDHAGTNPVEQSNYGDSSEMSQVSSVLVEYLSLGSVVRYNHLVDTYNHSFVCLRILETVPAPYPLRNIKYIEFRDIQKDWNYTGHPLEREFYDLDADPFEMHNIVSIVPSVLVEALSEKIRRMLQCKGWTCRKEHATGVEPFYESTMYVLQRTDN